MCVYIYIYIYSIKVMVIVILVIIVMIVIMELARGGESPGAVASRRVASVAPISRF